MNSDTPNDVGFQPTAPHFGVGRESTTVEIIAFSVGYVGLMGICIALMLLVVWILAKKAKRDSEKKKDRVEMTPLS